MQDALIPWARQKLYLSDEKTLPPLLMESGGAHRSRPMRFNYDCFAIRRGDDRSTLLFVLPQHLGTIPANRRRL